MSIILALFGRRVRCAICGDRLAIRRAVAHGIERVFTHSGACCDARAKADAEPGYYE